MNSIRSHLIAALIGAMVVAVCAGGWATYLTARSEADGLFDYQLQQIALSVRDQAFQGQAEALATNETLDYVIRVWNPSGLTVYSSRRHQSLPEITQLGYSTASSEEGEWRVFALQHHGMTIAVAQPMRVRDQLAAASAWQTVKPYLVLLPVLGILLWLLVSRGLKPLGDFAALIKDRRADSLEPLDTADLAEEIEPLAQSLNELLGRLKVALAAQRAFVADAAHELRTPLTALQLQVQLIERADSDSTRLAALNELKQALQRTAHTMHQMLTLARQEPGAVDDRHDTVVLAQLAEDVVIEHERLAESRQIDLGISRSDPKTLVTGDAEALRILLSNLVSNAVRYTPQGGRVDVSCGIDEDGPFLEVTDNGPGIAPDERTRVFDRFYRTERTSNEVPGSGLGLSIVRAIAERHRAKVVLDSSADGGLRCLVRFPAAST